MLNSKFLFHYQIMFTTTKHQSFYENLAAADIKSEKPGGDIDCNVSNINS